MRFTVVAPVHNEEAMLRQTLGSVFALGPDEVIIGSDRCTDGSEDLVLSAAEASRTPLTLRRFTGEDGTGWGFRPAYLRRELYALSRNDVILNTSADILLDPKISSYLGSIPDDYGLLSFHYYEKPWNLQCFERALLGRIKPGFAGLLAFSKRAWLETEDIDDLKTITRAEDTHLQMAIRSRYPVRHIHTRSLHLRPNERTEDHFNRGRAQYEVQGKPGLEAFLHSVVMLRPGVYAGWRYAKMMGRGVALPILIPLAAAAMLDDSTEEIP